jgi:hypothetical protein
VRWSDDEYVTVRGSEQDARKWLNTVGPVAYGVVGVVVHRTVMRSAWREPVSMEAVGAAIEAGGLMHCTMLGVEYWPDCDRCEATGRLEECPDCDGMGKIRPTNAGVTDA